MKNPEEIILKCISRKKQLKINEVISNVDKIIKIIKSKSFDQHMKEGNLNKLVYNLSVIMFNLGEMVAEYTAFANANYVYRKFKYYQEFRKIRKEVEKITISESEKQADENIGEYYVKQIESQYLADLLKTKYDECNRMVMVLQSVMKQSKDENLRSGGNSI